MVSNPFKSCQFLRTVKKGENMAGAPICTAFILAIVLAKRLNSLQLKKLTQDCRS